MTPFHNYIGIKAVQARPLTLGDYNTYRGWKIPDDEDPDKLGYLVKYPDGYESWCPLEQFEEANTLVRENGKLPIMKYFSYDHLPPHLQKISKPICDIAKIYDATTPDGPEKSAGLRKLLEAKDCLVRANL